MKRKRVWVAVVTCVMMMGLSYSTPTACHANSISDFAQCKRYVEQREFTKAIACLQKLLADHPSAVPEVEIRAWLMDAHLGNNQSALGLSEFQSLLREYPRYASELRHIVGRRYRRQSKFNEAITELSIALELNKLPTDNENVKDMRRQLMVAYIGKGDFVNAYEQLHIIMNDYPEEVSKFIVGEDFRWKSKLPDAIAELKKTIERLPKRNRESLSLRGELVKCVLATGNWQEAIAELQALIQDYPNDLRWQLSLIEIQLKFEQYEQAIPVCEEIIARDSNPGVSSNVLVLLAKCMHPLGRCEEALAIQDEYFSRHPKMKRKQDWVRSQTSFCSAKGSASDTVLPVVSVMDSSEYANLSSIFSNKADETTEYTKNHEVPLLTRKYESLGLEHITFQGYFVPTTSHTEIAIFSDDGVDVVVDNDDGDPLLDKEGIWQHLQTGSSSFQVPPYQEWTPGRVYELKVNYSNVVYIGESDIDGCTMYACKTEGSSSGGGTVYDWVNIDTDSDNDNDIDDDDDPLDETSPGKYVEMGEARAQADISFSPINGINSSKIAIVVTSGSDNIEVYTSETGGTKISPSSEYTIGTGVPEHVWIKAVQNGPAMLDVVFKTPGGVEICRDKVKFTVRGSIPPTVTINQALGQADPTNVSPINFTVVFDKSVSDFETGDVTLSGTAGATIAQVTSIGGSTTDYNVAVSGLTASGTVIASIAAGVAHDATNNGNVASTSTDNQVTVIPPANVICVDGEHGNDGNDGTAWDQAHAKATVWAALAAAHNSSTRKDVWVRAGSYDVPASGSFDMPPDVRLYGGFEGVETELDHRSPSEHETILEGNASHPVVVAPAFDYANIPIVDGFTIQHGETGVTISQDCILALSGNKIIDNTRGIYCAAIYCFIFNNIISAESGGTALTLQGYGEHDVINNTIVKSGHGVLVDNASPVLASNIVAFNTTEGIKAQNGASVTLSKNCVYANGPAPNRNTNYVGDGLTPDAGSITPTLVSPMFVNENGDYHLVEDSPCVDKGDNQYLEYINCFVPTDFDYFGNQREVDGDGVGVATVDIGAAELPQPCGFPTVTGPTGTISDLTPVITWTVAGTFNKYQVKVVNHNRLSDKWESGEIVGTSLSCQVLRQLLNNATYSVTVGLHAACGWKWSDPVEFTVALAEPLLPTFVPYCLQ